MLLVYPLGIPCLYFVLVWQARHKLNPDMLFVVTDVTCDGKLTSDCVHITDEMRHLARSITLIQGTASDVKKEAMKCHETEIAKQLSSRALSAREDSQRAIERRAGREAHRSSLVRIAVATRATKLRDRHIVPEKWEDYLPQEAAVVIHLQASSAVVEAELIRQYRDANPSVQLLSFLVGAYEVLSVCWSYARSSEPYPPPPG